MSSLSKRHFTAVVGSKNMDFIFLQVHPRQREKLSANFAPPVKAKGRILRSRNNTRIQKEDLRSLFRRNEKTGETD